MTPPKQKYKIGTRVKIADNMPKYMSHFPKGIEAIVQYTYTQKCGRHSEEDDKKYSLLLLDKEEGYNTSAWYDEYLLTLISDDIEDGETKLKKFLRWT